MPPDIFRRIVTAHDDQGRSCVAYDGPAPVVAPIGGPSGAVFHEVWNTPQSPFPVRAKFEEVVGTDIALEPEVGGTRFRVIDFQPGDRELSADEAKRMFAQFGGEHSLSKSSGEQHPLMHRTETIDYGIVLSGEIVMLLDVGETTAKAGDIVVQRGTNHAWVNRSDEVCRIAFILIDGRFADGLE